jgi:hypothetical protein
LTILAGCTPALTDGFGATLTETGGCGDVILYAANPDDTIMLRFEWKYLGQLNYSTNILDSVLPSSAN